MKLYILLQIITMLLCLPTPAFAWVAFITIVLEAIFYSYEFWALLAMSVVSIAMQETASGQQQKQTSTRGQLLNTCDSQVVLPLVYGRQRIGINRVYQGVSGTDNSTLHIVGALCEGEIEGLVSIDGVPQIYLSDQIYTDFGASFTYEFHTGSPTQTVSAALQAAIPEWTDPLKNTAYIICTLQFDLDKFQGVPEITCIVDGLKIYNPDTDVTELSDNPALCARDIITRTSYRGGMGISSSRLDDASVISCAAYCVIKGWTCNIVLLDQDSVINMLGQVLLCFRGDVVYSTTKFKMLYTDLNYETKVMEIDESDIAENNGASTLEIVQPDIFDTPNALRIKFTNIEKKYQLDDYVFADPVAIAADGDYREKEIYIRGFTSQTQVMQMANYFLERLRYNKTISFAMGAKGTALEPFDIIWVSIAAYGWVSKIFRIMETRLNIDGGVTVSAIEEILTLYDDTYNITARAWHDTTLPAPSDAVVSVADASVTEAQYYYRGRTFTRLTVAFDPPATTTYPWWDYADMYLKIGVAGDWNFMTKAVSNFILDPAEEGETYYFKIVSVSIFGTKEAFGDAIEVSHVVLGKESNPPDVTGFTGIAAGDAVILFATELADPDVQGYEVRLGAAWAGGILVGFNETPNIRLAGVKPGTHTFWMAARYNNGLYSEAPVSVQVEVFYPPNYTEKNSWQWDFDGEGEFTNTEHETHNSTDALKCSHGTYGSQYPLEHTDANVKATTKFSTSYWPYYATNPNKALTGSHADNAWVSVNLAVTNQRFHLDMGEAIVAKRIYYENGHSSGLYSDCGLKTFTIWGSNSATAFAELTYGTDTDWTQITAAQATFDQHSAADEEDPKYIALTNTTAYRYYAFKIADNWGLATSMGVRRLTIQTENANTLEGKWESPEYDLGSLKTVRVWGDFLTDFTSDDGTWASLFGTQTWAEVLGTKKWFEITAPAYASTLTSTIKWGTASGDYPNSADRFELSAVEFQARYIQIEVTIVDPFAGANLYLYELNMKAYYWS